MPHYGPPASTTLPRLAWSGRGLFFVYLLQNRKLTEYSLLLHILSDTLDLRRALSAYVTYYNRWRPHRSLGQATPWGEARPLPPRQACRKIAAEPVLGGLHPIYRAAA
jgi:transposase InsO family protein